MKISQIFEKIQKNLFSLLPAIRKSASKWDQIGERALVELWAERMPQLRGCRKNSHIHMEMASELAMQGFTYTPEELRTKMHNMTCRYR